MSTETAAVRLISTGKHANEAINKEFRKIAVI